MMRTSASRRAFSFEMIEMIQILEPGRRFPRSLASAILLSVTASITACGTQHQIRQATPGPAATPQVRSEVLILPLGQKTKEELDYWTSESQRLVLAYFDIFLRHGFSHATMDRVIVTDDTFETDAIEFAFQGTDQGNGQEWWSFVPQAGRLHYQGNTPDYVLIFDGLRFRVQSGGGSRQTYDVPGAGKVELDLEYVLWDNHSQEVVASGRLHEESQTSSPHPSSELFKRLFEKMAAEVVRRTPLNS